MFKFSSILWLPEFTDAHWLFLAVLQPEIEKLSYWITSSFCPPVHKDQDKYTKDSRHIAPLIDNGIMNRVIQNN